MKKLRLCKQIKFRLLLILFYAQCLSAQNPYRPAVFEVVSSRILEPSFLKVQYTMTFRGLDENDPQRLTDTRTVLIGKSFRKDSSYWMDKRESDNIERKAKGEMLFLSTESTIYPLDIMVGGEKDRILHRTLMNGPVLCYEIEHPALKWNLQTGDTTLLGYRCKQAVTEYKGRSYVAWYAEDIPVNAGPYVFDGLPGLILKIASTDGDYCWESKGLEESKEPIVVKGYGGKTKECTYAEARRIMENVYQHPYRYALQFVRSIRVRDAAGGTRDAGEKEFAISYFYNPIEKE